MGFVFFRCKTVIRKSIMLSASRLAKKMNKNKQKLRGYFHRHISAMISYMGWFSCTDTYHCYEEEIKPYVNIGNLKRIISKLQRRQNHESMETGKMLRAA